MTIQRVEVTKEELKQFQDEFIGSAMGNLVGRVLNQVMAEAQTVLERCSAGNDTIRQAQGMIAAIRRFDEITAEIAKTDPEKPDDEVGEDDIERGGIDVSF